MGMTDKKLPTPILHPISKLKSDPPGGRFPQDRIVDPPLRRHAGKIHARYWTNGIGKKTPLCCPIPFMNEVSVYALKEDPLTGRFNNREACDRQRGSATPTCLTEGCRFTHGERVRFFVPQAAFVLLYRESVPVPKREVGCTWHTHGNS